MGLQCRKQTDKILSEISKNAFHKLRLEGPAGQRMVTKRLLVRAPAPAVGKPAISSPRANPGF